MNLFFSILKALYFALKGSLNIPEYRSLFIGRVLQLYNMKPAVEHIAYSSL